uniref:CCHC-type domain-containing protein n=1 Tax=Xenopus tropicalis TaxID=8364 RepID=A0A6I8RNS8_XENTR
MDFVLRGEEEGTGKGQSAVVSVPKPSDVPSVSNLPTSNPPTSNPPTSNPPTSNPPTSNPSNPIVSASSVDNGNNMLVTPDNVLGKANKVANPTKSMEMSNAGGEDQGSKGFWEKRRFFARQQETLFDGPVFKRINVVKIKWDGEKEKMPGSRYICKNLIKESMGFTPSDVNAFITVSDVEFEVSFKLPQGLDRFWSLYQEKGRSPEWEGFRAIPVSKPEVKNVTVIFKNESIPPEDVLVWLKRQCKVLAPLTRLYNEEGFWIVGWKVQVRLDVSNNVTKHLPNSFFIGKERGVCFYPGQPKQCFKCGSKRHLANDCTLKVCALCGAQGHVSKECNKVRCNLCNDLGHTHRECPEAWHNIVREWVVGI